MIFNGSVDEPRAEMNGSGAAVPVRVTRIHRCAKGQRESQPLHGTVDTIVPHAMSDGF